TRKYAKLIDSSALMADAWHHRSDALSSIGSLIGIVGSRLGLKWFDAVASLIICVLIVKAAYDIFANSIKKMTDHACDVSVQNDMIKCAKSVDGVEGVYRIKTREFGNKIYVDLEVLANGDITLLQSSEIGKNVHNKMEQSFPKIKHIVVLVKPLEGHAKID
ncbi:MAG: cation diffusion facilitator family transporter, partial [Clostridia bacterium]|nr:cation diffusion facilitator family transporter [Clostridia bacterium]